LNVREKGFPNIPAQKGPQIGPPRGPIWDPLFEGSREAPGHLNVREKGFGHITAQKGPRIGPKRASQGGPRDPILGPVLRPKPLLFPNVLANYCSDRGLPGGPWEGPGRPYFGALLRPNPLLCPHVYRDCCSGGPQIGASQGGPRALFYLGISVRRALGPWPQGPVLPRNLGR
jgi:hypothetical protein